MKILKVTSQHRRDFYAVYECEHCKHKQKGHGYDDSNFHDTVIPTLVCSECGKTAPKESVPRAPKYSDSQTI